jgi:mono/diheme cytochrome c family protein
MRANWIPAFAGMTKVSPGMTKVTPAVAAALIVAACASTEAPAPKVAAAKPSFDKALIARGEALSALGNCRTCHTSADGKSYAGGVPFKTSFGTVYSTNITPDVESGIGAWTEAEFARAMREGVDREGHHLYPVFPYDHFTHVTDEDDRAIYAFLMSRTPVRAPHPHNELIFPFNLRSALGAWKELYFKPGPHHDDPARSRAYNRGAYLVDGLGHCGGCHTPRNAAGAEIAGRELDGGEAEGWHAYAINARSQAPTPWTEAALAAYLKHGWQADHGVSRGPMAPVTDELADVPEEDLRAMAAYLVTLMGPRDNAPALARPTAQASASEGAMLYAAACAQCHDGAQALPFGGITLPQSIGVSGESPRDLFNVILYGLPPAEGETAPMMPAFSGAFDDRQLLEMASWMRLRFSRKPPWPDAEMEHELREARRKGGEGARFPAGGRASDPAKGT